MILAFLVFIESLIIVMISYKHGYSRGYRAGWDDLFHIRFLMNKRRIDGKNN